MGEFKDVDEGEKKHARRKNKLSIHKVYICSEQIQFVFVVLCLLHWHIISLKRVIRVLNFTLLLPLAAHSLQLVQVGRENQALLFKVAILWNSKLLPNSCGWQMVRNRIFAVGSTVDSWIFHAKQSLNGKKKKENECVYNLYASLGAYASFQMIT